MSFYSSNEKKQKAYLKEREIQEENDFEQQERVDEALARELGLEERATKTALMAKRISKALSSLMTPEKRNSVNDILVNAINNNKLTELFDKIKNLPDSVLNTKQQLIRNDLYNSDNKSIINELIQEALPGGVDAIRKTVIEALGGTENTDLVADMIYKTSKLNNNSLSKPVKVSTDNKSTSMDLERVLDHIVENNNLSKLFDELKNIPDNELNKYGKKIKKKLNNDDVKDIINSLISDAVDNSDQKKIKNIILNQLVDTVKEREALKDMVMKSITVTSVMSDEPKIDLRVYNKGAPKIDTNKELNEFSELLVKYNKSKGGERKDLNSTLNNMINRQKEINPKIAERMKELKSALHRIKKKIN